MVGTLCQGDGVAGVVGIRPVRLCRQSELFGVCVLEDIDQLLLRISSPLSSRSFNT